MAHVVMLRWLLAPSLYKYHQGTEILGLHLAQHLIVDTIQLLFSNGEFPVSHPFRSIRAAPDDVALPPVWLLGSSGFSAQLSAQLGLAFAFAFHINPNNAMQALHSYRENFKPSAQLQQPRSLITASIVCAETDERAEELAASVDLALVRIITGRSAPLTTPEEARAYPYTAGERFQIRANRARLIVGSPATVRARVTQLVEQSGADEAMLTTFVYGHENRVRALELLAEAFELQQHITRYCFNP